MSNNTKPLLKGSSTNNFRQRLEGGVPFPVALSRYGIELSAALNARPIESFERIPLGFEQIDYALGGGIMPGVLGVLLGRQNTGKTAFFLQAAYNIARWAREEQNRVVAINFCYEHPVWVQFSRLLAMVSNGAASPAEIEKVVKAKREELGTPQDLWTQVLRELPPDVTKGYERLVAVGDHLALHHADRFHTTTQSLETVIKHHLEQGDFPVVMVDYLQVIPPRPEMASLALAGGAGGAKAVQIATLRELSALASRHNVPVFCIAAVDDAALRRKGPVHLEDVEGEGTNLLPYMVEYALVLNPDAEYWRGEAGTLDEEQSLWVRLAIEKVRGGHRPPGVEWRFRFDRRRMQFVQPGEEIPPAERYALQRFMPQGKG